MTDQQPTPPSLSLNPLLRVVLFMVVGMVVGFRISEQYIANLHVYAALAFFVTVILSLLFFRRRYLSGGMLLVSCLAFGLWLAVNADRKGRVVFPATEVEYDAVLFSEPVRHGKVVMCDLVLPGLPSNTTVQASILCDTVSERYLRLHVGDGIHAYSAFEKPGCRARRYRTFIYYSNWEKAAVSLKTLSLSSRLRLRALKLRQQLVSRLMSTTAGHDELAVVVAMTLGDKSLLTKDVKDMYSVTAASHVLALSGLHLSILYGVIMLLLAPFRRRLLVQVLLLTTIWTYTWLVGLSPSVVRAATMLSIYSIVTLLYRDRVSFNVLAFSAILMLIISPHSLLDVGFQLSYLSVAAILLFVPLLTYAVRNTLIRRWRLTSWLYDLLAVSVAAQLGTAPLVAYYFGRFSCLFLLSSLFAVPLVTLILWVALLFFLTAFLPAVQLWIGSVLTALARLLNGSLAAIASIPGASIEHLRPSVAQVIGCYILILVAYTFILILLRRHVNRY